MREIEARFKVLPPAFRQVRKILAKSGGNCIWKGVEKNIFFDTPDSALAHRGSSLRLRKWQGHSVSLTLKDKVASGKRRYKEEEEYQILVAGFSPAYDLLRALGYAEIERYEKRREHWKIGRTFIELDRVCGKCFIEIEGSRSAINKLARVFKLSWRDASTQSYRALIKELRSQK